MKLKRNLGTQPFFRTIRLDPQLEKQLVEFMAKQHTTASWTIRAALRAFLSRVRA